MKDVEGGGTVYKKRRRRLATKEEQTKNIEENSNIKEIGCSESDREN